MQFARSLAALSGIATLFAGATAAQAECRGQSGHVYVTAYCVQEYRSNPENICHLPREDEAGNRPEAQTVQFFSNVIYDNYSNRRYPFSQFNDEIELQHDVSLADFKGRRVSTCFSNYDAAVDALRNEMARFRRRTRDGKIVRVGMGDS